MYSDDYKAGFAEALKIAEEWLQLARAGEIDQDWRSVIAIVRDSNPGDTPVLIVKGWRD